ncbi:hypothetical protein EKG37_08810 [Robertmurraya yapensis]|uniref:Uncharacterized protein n=2 Tax=Bacillaceae TaxID=186817 RepID=A0A431WCZ1_9BACI|nr:hypothetical protein [Bacillus yapensis]RTR33147.1 hypothetical protein EKG37_08810 [Bacillus yapensis]TKS96970.1 hypothetical protein FAR12_08810 [Bacillus yapensis]
MKLFQVRKGQFVYFNNELHKVYGVKPMYKLSIHLIKLRDLSQHITNAASVERYIPREDDSFIFNHKVYTLRNNQKPAAGDLILINNPVPDTLDHYSLNEIETVEKIDSKGVITSDLNGIKHSEYLLMVPGRAPDSHPIDYKDMASVDENLDETETQIIHPYSDLSVQLGDVYKKKDHDVLIEAMVVAIRGHTVFLGGGLEIQHEELMNTDMWEFQYNPFNN